MSDEETRLRAENALLKAQCDRSFAENVRLRAIVRAATAIHNRNVWHYEKAIEKGHVKPGELEAAMEELRQHFARIEPAEQ